MGKKVNNFNKRTISRAVKNSENQRELKGSIFGLCSSLCYGTSSYLTIHSEET